MMFKPLVKMTPYVKQRLVVSAPTTLTSSELASALNTIASLQATVVSLQNQVTTLQAQAIIDAATIAALNATIVTLNATIASLQAQILAFNASYLRGNVAKITAVGGGVNVPPAYANPIVSISGLYPPTNSRVLPITTVGGGYP
jgi:hypothetical protein